MSSGSAIDSLLLVVDGSGEPTRLVTITTNSGVSALALVAAVDHLPYTTRSTDAAVGVVVHVTGTAGLKVGNYAVPSDVARLVSVVLIGPQLAEPVP